MIRRLVPVALVALSLALPATVAASRMERPAVVTAPPAIECPGDPHETDTPEEAARTAVVVMVARVLEGGPESHRAVLEVLHVVRGRYEARTIELGGAQCDREMARGVVRPGAWYVLAFHEPPVRKSASFTSFQFVSYPGDPNPETWADWTPLEKLAPLLQRLPDTATDRSNSPLALLGALLVFAGMVRLRRT